MKTQKQIVNQMLSNKKNATRKAARQIMEMYAMDWNGQSGRGECDYIHMTRDQYLGAMEALTTIGLIDLHTPHNGFYGEFDYRVLIDFKNLIVS